MERLSFQTGETILAEGSTGAEFYVVESGKAKVIKTFEQETIELGTLGEGDFFGEMSMLMNRPRSATVIATEPTVIQAYKRDRFVNIFQQNPDQAMEIIKTLVSRLHGAHDIIQKIEGEKEAFKNYISLGL